MKKVLLIHGPNLNLTGQREPGIYGSNTLASINAEVVQKCERLGMECAVFQSNSEGALIDRIHDCRLPLSSFPSSLLVRLWGIMMRSLSRSWLLTSIS